MDNNFSDNRNSFLEMTFLNSINWISVIHKIIGIILMIQGVLTSLTIIGAIIGVPIIFAGKNLFASGGNLSDYKFSRSINEIKKFFINYKKYWKVIFMIYIAGIVSVLLFIGILVFSAINASKSLPKSNPNDGIASISTTNDNNTNTTNTTTDQPSNDQSAPELDELHKLMEEVVTNGNTDALNKYSKDQLRLLRNTLYAEKGYIFTGDLKNYFDSKPWYHGTVADQDTIQLTDYEKAFINAIKQKEGLPIIENDGSASSSTNGGGEELDELHEVMDEVVNGNESVLENYSKEKLRLLRNTLYAEKGYIFTGDLKGYFNSKPWYHGHISNQDSIPLSSEEKVFVDAIKKYENQ
ncbi:DUF5362 family protein [Leptotrichia sp.]|uniref:DUF5362 family protein n=1 Tax=Leptotrichia sp. TaxID=104608 RepID=UPI0017F75EF6|nr:DUF5362 family protein [Leptotrichia sp.]MBB1534978.1 YARHG domain-containing protein [Leptotrichia sp.]